MSDVRNTRENIRQAVAVMVDRSEIFVACCERYMFRMSGTKTGTSSHPVVALLFEPILAYREAETDRDKIKAAEDLADIIWRAIITAKIPEYEMPPGALTNYRDPTGRVCDTCGKVEAKNYIAGKLICARCLLDLKW